VVGEKVERGGVIYPRTLFGKSVLAHIFVEKTIRRRVANGIEKLKITESVLTSFVLPFSPALFGWFCRLASSEETPVVPL